MQELRVLDFGFWGYTFWRGFFRFKWFRCSGVWRWAFGHDGRDCGGAWRCRTLVIERHGFPGGSSTAALVHPWLSYHNKRGEQVLAGLGQELVDRLCAVGGAVGHLRDSIGFVHSLTPFDPDLTKQVMLQMLTESGAQILLHSFVLGVERDNDRVTAVRIINKSGEYSIPAKVLIDTTGDADVAFRGGAPIQNRVLDGQLTTQPMTMYFRMSGVDWVPIRRYILDNPDEFHHETLFDDLRRGEPLTGVSGYFSLWRAAQAELGIRATVCCFSPAFGPTSVTSTPAASRSSMVPMASICRRPKLKVVVRLGFWPIGCAVPLMVFKAPTFPPSRRKLVCANRGASWANTC
jgi:hypothetical protein